MPKTVTVKDLVEKYGVDGKQVRTIARSIGLRAKKLDNEGQFGPQSRYEWEEGSDGLEKLEEAIEAHLDRRSEDE